ncbi:unnamed protein product [Camellia sinensis]
MLVSRTPELSLFTFSLLSNSNPNPKPSKFISIPMRTALTILRSLSPSLHHYHHHRRLLRSISLPILSFSGTPTRRLSSFAPPSAAPLSTFVEHLADETDSDAVRENSDFSRNREAESFNFDVSFESTDLKNLNSPPLEVWELEELPEQWRRTKLAWLCKELPKHKAATLIRILNAQRKTRLVLGKLGKLKESGILAVGIDEIHKLTSPFSTLMSPLTLVPYNLSRLVSREDKVNLVEEIGEACKNWGFFQVINHGVPLETREKFESAARKFFAQSTEEKRKVRRDKVNPQGYYDTELTKNVRDWKEVFDLTVKNPTVIPASYEPSDKEVRELVNRWPEYPPEFREAFEEYATEMEKLSHKLLGLISLSLGLPENRLSGFFNDHISFIRLNHYPPCPIPHLALGVDRHKDGGALTVLAQDDVGGLEVNVWSNEKYESVEHRVTVNSEREILNPILLQSGPSCHGGAFRGADN